jgi:hypothetical protein
MVLSSMMGHAARTTERRTPLQLLVRFGSVRTTAPSNSPTGMSCDRVDRIYDAAEATTAADWAEGLGLTFSQTTASPAFCRGRVSW